MSKIDEIRSVVVNFNSDPGTKSLPNEDKVTGIFKKMNFDSIWCALLNFFTCGWYNERNIALIEQVLNENSIPSPTATPEPSHLGTPVPTPDCVKEAQGQFYDVEF